MTLSHHKQNLAHEEIEDSNPSNNIDFQTIISRRLNRRSLLKGGTGLTAAAFFGTLPLVGCNSEDSQFSGRPVIKNDSCLGYIKPP